MRDMKQALTGSRPKLSILGRASMNHECRVREYGADKYARGNYHGAPPASVTAEDRVMGYIDAAMRHLTRIADAYNHALGRGGDLREALATVDDDGGGKFPASNLPDLSHALTSLAIGIQCAVDDGILPLDPGQPWKAPSSEVGLPQKDNPAAERARIDLLVAEREMERALQQRTEMERTLQQRALVAARVASGAFDVLEMEKVPRSEFDVGGDGGLYRG